MTDWLISRYMGKDAQVAIPDSHVRERYGRLAGIVAIFVNLVLFAAKFCIGFFSGSISIMADAVNNLADCASGIITLVGFYLSGMPADEQHPYGHARFEYISGLVVSLFIIAVGLEFFTSSLQKVLHPEPVDFSWVLAAVLLLSIAAKLWLRAFNRKIGRRISSSTLLAAATDSRNDVISTSVVLASAIVAHSTGWQLDGYMGMAVAVFILVSAVQLVRETLSPLLGMAPDKELVAEIERRILAYESVIGLHDLMVHSYGPGRYFASVHVEFPAKQDIMVSHDIIDRIERDFERNLNIALVVHLDPVVTDDPRVNEMRARVEAIVQALDPVLTIHDFRMVEGKTHTNLIFDVVLPPRYKMTDNAVRHEIQQKVQLLDEALHCVIRVDRSYTSTTN